MPPQKSAVWNYFKRSLMEILSNALFTISPADEKILSEGTDVAGTANTHFAITDNHGYLVSLSAHHSSGDFFKSDLSSR
jgi:hypothetical protein